MVGATELNLSNVTVEFVSLWPWHHSDFPDNLIEPFITLASVMVQFQLDQTLV